GWLSCQKSAEAILGRKRLKGRTSGGFRSLRHSKDTRREQKTSKEGWPAKNRVEPESMPGTPIKGRIRALIQSKEKSSHGKKLKRIAAKARKEIKLRFTSLAHHITRELIMSKIFSIVRSEEGREEEHIMHLLL
ncbi:MAG: hypothetical protein SVV67_11090, partial [Bacillota bacterium]|nr:hypothetical protein [Bacillota bacterium]